MAWVPLQQSRFLAGFRPKLYRIFNTRLLPELFAISILQALIIRIFSAHGLAEDSLRGCAARFFKAGYPRFSLQVNRCAAHVAFLGVHKGMTGRLSLSTASTGARIEGISLTDVSDYLNSPDFGKLTFVALDFKGNRLSHNTQHSVPESDLTRKANI